MGTVQTHRVVASSCGGLAGWVGVHSVDDSLPLALLVDLTEAAAGLPVRGLSLEVLLILVHIVHLGEERRGKNMGRREVGVSVFIFHSRLTPPNPSHPEKASHTPRNLLYSCHLLPLLLLTLLFFLVRLLSLPIVAKIEFACGLFGLRVYVYTKKEQGSQNIKRSQDRNYISTKKR